MRCFLSAGLALALLTPATAAKAGLFKAAVDRTKAAVAKAKVEFHRNNMWPEPFVHADRATVRAPFGIMIDNGWRLQNTLADHHFEEDSLTLNESGREKLRTILTENPIERRSPFVLRGKTADITAARVQSVMESGAEILPGETIDVVETHIRPHGWSAEYIDSIGRRFRSSTPTPRLSVASDDEEE